MIKKELQEIEFVLYMLKENKKLYNWETKEAWEAARAAIEKLQAIEQQESQNTRDLMGIEFVLHAVVAKDQLREGNEIETAWGLADKLLKEVA